jgi:hypothetical protein
VFLNRKTKTRDDPSAFWRRISSAIKICKWRRSSRSAWLVGHGDWHGCRSRIEFEESKSNSMYGLEWRERQECVEENFPGVRIVENNISTVEIVQTVSQLSRLLSTDVPLR